MLILFLSLVKSILLNNLYTIISFPIFKKIQFEFLFKNLKLYLDATSTRQTSSGEDPQNQVFPSFSSTTTSWQTIMQSQKSKNSQYSSPFSKESESSMRDKRLYSSLSECSFLPIVAYLKTIVLHVSVPVFWNIIKTSNKKLPYQ